MEVGKRYQRVNGEYVENEKGRWLAKKLFGKVGALDLAKKTNLGYPINKATGKAYVDEGFADDVEAAVSATKVDVCPHCGGKL